jgi:hypothetical protein
VATTWPSSPDALANPLTTDPMTAAAVPHATQHANINDILEALEAQLGITGSAVTSSHDYRIAQLEGALDTPGIWTSSFGWSAVSSNPALGNSPTATGYHALFGKTHELRYNIAMGSTTTYGSGAWIIPLSGTSAANGPQAIPGWCYDASSGITYPVYLAIPVSSTTAQILIADGVTAGYVDSTHPFTWGTNDYIRLQGTYEET